MSDDDIFNEPADKFRQRIRKRKKKNSQTPTTIPFWRQLSQNVDSKSTDISSGSSDIGTPSPSQSIRPGKPYQPIAPDIPGQSIRPFIPSQLLRPGNPGKFPAPIKPGQNIRPGNSAGVIRPNKPSPGIRSDKPGHSVRPNNPGQNIRPNNPGQNIRPTNPGQQIRRTNPGQNIRPSNRGQTICPTYPAQGIRQGNPSQGNPGHTIRPGNPGQSNQPGKPTQQIPATKTNLPSNPKKPQVQAGSASSQPIEKPEQGSKFKPLQEVGKPIDIFSTDTSPTPVPQPYKPQDVPESMLQPSNSPVITIIGKKEAMTQQKKILKFQMRIHTLQQEKKRQELEAKKLLESSMIIKNIMNEMGTPPLATNIGVPNPGQMQNFGNMPYPTGVPNPEAVGAISNMPVMPNPGVMFNPGMPNMVGGPLQQPMANFIGVPSQPDPVPVPMYQNPINAVPVPITPVAVSQSETVRTVFHIAKKVKKPKATIQSQPQQSTNPNRLDPARFDKADQFGYKYPKGVPKSFLLQQQNSTQPAAPDAPIWPTFAPTPVPTPSDRATSPMLDDQGDIPQPYSPSELYNDLDKSQTPDYYDDLESPEPSQSGQKRLSAFRRLGPQTQPKKPKMTISVTVNENQEIREVVDETVELEEITPVHLREDMILSTDETVIKYLKCWPWKRNVIIRKSVTARNSKTVMMLEREQMEEIYDKETLFVQVTVKGYPSYWKKEDVLDTLMENIRQYSFIPCFIEFNREECKFLTLRCRSALLTFHKCGFIIRKNEVELTITIAQTELTLSQLDFVPRLVLRKRLIMCADNEHKLDLSAFTLKEDISHFIYFPLNRSNNQMEIIEMQNEVSWGYLTDLNLSHNRITSIDGFDLEQTAPKLQHLDLSHNLLEKATLLLKCRNLPLRTIRLEGNPLCTNYTDPDQYVKVLKMMFTSLTDIDGVPVHFKGEMPKFRRNYCPSDAKELVDKFLEIYFPLLEGDIEHRASLQNMYKEDANMTITYNYKLAFSPIYRCFKSLFTNARQLEEDKLYMIKGSSAIVKTIVNWPHMEHDPFTFTVDVVFHCDTTTIIRVDGMLKLTRESLAEDEHLLAFSRTLVLHTRDYVEYKVQAEMVYWSVPSGDYARSAFAVTAIKTKQMYPKIESTTDEELQAELLKIFMSLTSMNKKVSERCLELKKWNIKEALDHFTKLLRLDSLETLIKEVS